MTGQRIAWYRLVYSSSLAKVLADPTLVLTASPIKEPYPGEVL